MLGNNPAQQQALVGKLSDMQLQQELRQPSGAAPTYMVMAEIQKRQQMRQGGANAGYAPGATIRQQMLAQMGTLPPMGSPAPSAIPLPNQPPIIPPNMTVQRTPQGFASGGAIPHYDVGGGIGLGAAMGQGGYFGQAPLAAPAPPPAPAPVMPAGQQAPAATDEFGLPLDAHQWTRADMMKYADIQNQLHGFPDGMLPSVITQESSWDPHARSSVGAKGLGQLMDGTAKGLGVSDPYDPRQNINGSAAYLAQQYHTFGNWNDGLIAYNAGPGNAGTSPKNPKAYAMGSRYAQDVLGRVDPSAVGGAGGPGAAAITPDDSAQQAILNKILSQDPSGRPIGDYLSQVQGQFKDPTAAYANILSTLQQQMGQVNQQNKAMALLRMGMGMMQSRSPNFLTALGEGGTQGLDTYAAGMQQQRQMQMEMAQAQLAQATGSSQYQMEAFKEAQAMREADISKTLQQQGIAASLADKIAYQRMMGQMYAGRNATQLQVAGIRSNAVQGAADTRANASMTDAQIRAQAAMDDARQRAGAQIMSRLGPTAWGALGPAGQAALINQQINGVANAPPNAPGKTGSIGAPGTRILDLNGNVIQGG